MVGFFTIVEFIGDDDVAGFKVQAKVKSQMNENIIGFLWLPPYLRQGQSNIDKGSTVWGILDEVTGLGCAMMGIGDADFGYFYDADIQVKKKLTVDDKLDVTKDITSSSGDVKAGSISLKTHTHPATLSVSTTGSPTAQTGTATGNTQAPQ